MPAPLVEFRSVRKSYGDKLILPGLELTVAEGEFLTLLGPSGCGKTTVLRLLAGFETPDSGTLHLDGVCLNAILPERRPVNTVFQSYALFPHLTVAANVGFSLRLQRLPRTEIAHRVREALARVQLTALAERKPGQLSGGQQQRVALARALINRPRVLLLDEPLSALDVRLRQAMQTELKALQRELGLTFLFVTHDQEEALSLSDRIAVLRAGVIQQCGTPREIYEHPANRFVARFVGDGNLLDGVVLGPAAAGCVAVRLGAVTVACLATQSWPPGTAVQVLLRPEAVQLAPAAAGNPASQLLGVIEDQTYKGMLQDTLVRLDSGGMLRASGWRDALAAGWPVGERVAVSWSPDAATLLAATEPE